MAVIEEIRTVRSFVSIRLDRGDTVWLRREDLPGMNLAEGLEVDDDAFDQAVRVRQYPRALDLAVAMLARRPCSKGEIRSRLKYRRYKDDVAELVVYKLEKEKFLDDEEFCRQWISFRQSRHFGPAAIGRELRMKGVAQELIDSAFSRPDFDCGEEEHALEIARKAWKRASSGGDPGTARRKVIASVVRRGFSWETARKACDLAEKQITDKISE